MGTYEYQDDDGNACIGGEPSDEEEAANTFGAEELSADEIKDL